MKSYLTKIIEGQILTREETHIIMLGITQQKYNECQIASLLMALQVRGITVDELLGFRDGLLEIGCQINLDGYETLDIVGTGGLIIRGCRCRLQGLEAWQRQFHLCVGCLQCASGPWCEVHG